MNGFMHNGVYYRINMDLVGELMTSFMPPSMEVRPFKVGPDELSFAEAFVRAISKRWGNSYHICRYVAFLRRFKSDVTDPGPNHL